MLTTRKNSSKLLVALAVAIAASAVLTSTAAAKFGDSRPQGYQGVTQQNSDSGVTPTDLARAVPRDSNAPAGVTPTDLARSVPVTGDTAVRIESAKSDPLWSSADRDLAIGFGLGLALAIFASVGLVMARNRTRLAHS
jgi:DNA-binding XRE family transcriptional regulator